MLHLEQAELIIISAGLAGIIILYLFMKRRRSRRRRRDGLSVEYFKGLNYLLNDEQGKALDIFVKLVESNWDIIDTHFALGKIFRKNGEIDKAIKIHQGLMARPSLPERYRNKVLLELGSDYLGAGWFDRAEGLFKEVLIHDKQSVQARHNLILIYQQEKDWHKAIDVGVDLFREDPSSVGPMVAQYYCELADNSRIKGDTAQQEHNANQALKYDSSCVRASLHLGELAMSRQDYKMALRCYQDIEEQDAEFLPTVIESIIECYHQLQRSDDLLDYLERIEQEHPDIYMMDRIVVAIDRYRDQAAAEEYLLNSLRKKSSLKTMQLLLEYKRRSEECGPAFKVMSDALEKLYSERSDYQCRYCGFQANTHYWQCPSCKSWAQVKPGLVEKLTAGDKTIIESYF